MHLSHRAGAACRTEGAEPANRTRPDEKTTAALCANAHGFSLHAGVGCGAHQREELERLCRYITRPAIANERLQRNDEGQVVLQLKSAWRDGTTHIKMSPLEFMQRLAALVPRPRLHLIRFHGVLAPHATLRAAIVPGSGAEYKRTCSRAHAWRAGAHELGAPAQARLRHRYRSLPALWRRLEDHRRHRRSRGERRDPHASGIACARSTTLTGAAAGVVPSDLTLEPGTVLQQRRRSGTHAA
jgi:hypothetical protein